MDKSKMKIICELVSITCNRKRKMSFGRRKMDANAIFVSVYYDFLFHENFYTALKTD